MLATLGTKPDVIVAGGGSGAPSIWPLVQTMLVLGVLFYLLKAFGPKIVQRMNKRLTPDLDSPIRVHESVPCGPATLQVIEVRGRQLLIAISPQGLTYLTDVTERTEAQAPTQAAAFFELVDEAESQIEDPAEAPEQPAEPDPLRAFERLARLTEVK